ncbi:jg13627, partial [Pararge aegeria aegeria]
CDAVVVAAAAVVLCGAYKHPSGWQDWAVRARPQPQLAGAHRSYACNYVRPPHGWRQKRVRSLRPHLIIII